MKIKSVKSVFKVLISSIAVLTCMCVLFFLLSASNAAKQNVASPLSGNGITLSNAAETKGFGTAKGAASIQPLALSNYTANLKYVSLSNLNPFAKKGPSLKNMTLTFDDEFNGTQLDTTQWKGYADKSKRRIGYWDSASQVSVSGGNMIINVEYKKNGPQGPGYYAAGVSTKGGKFGKQRYGYFEMRAKMPRTTGFWGAFWMSMEKAGYNKNGRDGTEIDIMESMYYPLPMIDSALWWNYSNLQGHPEYSFVTGNMYTSYHTYGLLWTPTEYQFYTDGKLTWKTRVGGVSQVGEYMILSLEMPNTIPNNNIKGQFCVDYIRAYQFNNQLKN